MSQVICLGELLVDRIANQVGGEIASIQSWTDYPGGAPANVACALQRLGTSSAFLGAVGWDLVGDRLLATLTQYQVETSLIQRNSKAPTRQVYVTRNGEGDRAFAGFSNSSSQCFADELLTYHPKDEAFFQECDYLYLGTLVLANKTARHAVDAYLKLAQAQNIQCFMDINWRPMFWQHPDEAKAIIWERLNLIDYLKVSEEEAHWLFDTDRPENIRDRLPHLKGIFMTLGERGCRYHLEKFSGEVSGFEVKAVDTTGAGDGFVAGCLHQLASNVTLNHEADAEQFVRYANAVGGLSTSQLGAIAPHPTSRDVELILKNSAV